MMIAAFCPLVKPNAAAKSASGVVTATPFKDSAAYTPAIDVFTVTPFTLIVAFAPLLFDSAYVAGAERCV